MKPNILSQLKSIAVEFFANNKYLLTPGMIFTTVLIATIIASKDTEEMDPRIIHYNYGQQAAQGELIGFNPLAAVDSYLRNVLSNPKEVENMFLIKENITFDQEFNITGLTPNGSGFFIDTSNYASISSEDLAIIIEGLQTNWSGYSFTDISFILTYTHENQANLSELMKNLGIFGINYDPKDYRQVLSLTYSYTNDNGIERYDVQSANKIFYLKTDGYNSKLVFERSTFFINGKKSEYGEVITLNNAFTPDAAIDKSINMSDSSWHIYETAMENYLAKITSPDMFDELTGLDK